MRSEHDVQASGKRGTWATLAFVVLIVVYILSYAPYLRWHYGASSVMFPAVDDGVFWSYNPDDPFFSQTEHLGYRPVEWLIDHTPLDRPLMWWAGVWDVQGKALQDSSSRTLVFPETWDELVQ